MSQNLATFDAGLEGLDALGAYDALCLLVCADERPLSGAAGFSDWRLCGALSRLLLDGEFEGALNEQLLMPSRGKLRPAYLLLVGAGVRAELTAERLNGLSRRAAEVVKKAGARSAALGLPTPLDDTARAEAFKHHFAPVFGFSGVALLAERGVRGLI